MNRAVCEPARSTFKENAMDTNTLLLIVIVLLLLGGGYYGRKRWF
ncbi:MAG TPA: LPXTG cell wall anchor domain-containing protein [Geobacterales bacterium]|jgi:LPXTG-motif cell wall-anchored protein|nr:LPXTG cell wall anchor domain-containing protein [Geobacterales bacterium]